MCIFMRCSALREPTIPTENYNLWFASGDPSKLGCFMLNIEFDEVSGLLDNQLFFQTREVSSPPCIG